MTDEEFAHMVSGALDAGVSVADIAISLGVSQPTVRRWASGVTSPHPLMRPPVRRVIAQLLTDSRGYP